MRPDSNLRRIHGLDMEVVQGDIRDAGMLRSALKGCERVYHAAALYTLNDPPRRYDEINVNGTANVIQAAVQAGVRRVVYTSTAAAVGSAPDGGLADEETDWNLGDLDIPYYVRQLGRNELLNSRGHRVNVGQSVTDQATLWGNNPGWAPLAPLDNNTGRTNAGGAPLTPAQLTHYFDDSSVSFVNGQLQDLLAASDPHYFERVTRMLTEILQLRGLRMNIHGQPFPEETIPGDTEDPGTNIASVVLDGDVPPPPRSATTQTLRDADFIYDYDHGRAQRWIVRNSANVIVYPPPAGPAPAGPPPVP